MRCLVMLSLACLFPIFLASQDKECSGAEISTYESFLYGRFEVRMQSAEGDGIVSSFFLFNKEVGCNFPQENNEIDVEMTGNDQNLYFTSHHPGDENPWFYGENFDLGFSPHEAMHDYAIEWEPGVVRWFVDNELIYTQDEEAANDLMYPMAIYMNIWAASFEDWTGVWDPSVLPRTSIYDYVKYYEYDPGNGDYGTASNYKFSWEDNFATFDSERWDKSDFLEFQNNYCTYRTANISNSNDHLLLKIDEPITDIEKVKVKFQVNTESEGISDSDVVYVTGNFNDWCGPCLAMNRNGDQWELELDLDPGRYEYLYLLNNWDNKGSAPLGSECDLHPCDEFNNYGFTASAGEIELELESFCWNSCAQCLTSSSSEVSISEDRKLKCIYDISGRKVDFRFDTLLFYVYDDGRVEKRIVLR